MILVRLVTFKEFR